MENGFIKLYRQIQEWEWYRDSATVHFFIHCILSANWKDNRWQGNDIKRGQFVTSLQNLSAQTGLSVKQIRTRIKRLVESGEIKQKGANKFTIITVCKYDTYQPKHEDEGQTKGKQRANKGQTKGNNEEGKEYKEGKEYSGVEVLSESIYEFELFWDDYDKKVDRTKCEKKWGGISESEKEVIKEFVPIYVRSTPEKKYRKNPLSFLNAKTWNDDWSEYQPKAKNHDQFIDKLFKN